jgi:hypothetical protein
MILSVERRAARGITINANYTWSHCIGLGEASLYNPMGANANVTYTDPNNRDFDRGNCDSDRRQIFNLTSVAETPSFSNPTLHKIATGWRFSAIYRRSSGNPINVVSGQDRALSGINDQRASLTGANPYTGSSAGSANYLNPAAFTMPDLGTLGNMGYNLLRGPATWSFDVALSRAFQLRERQRLEFRGEAFNVTNSFRPQNPNGSLSNNTFGQIRTAYEPRILQFALKYVF